MGAAKFLLMAAVLSVCSCKVQAQDFSTNFSWINTVGASTSSTTVNACNNAILITLTTGTGHVPMSPSSVLFPIGSTTNSIDTVIEVQLNFSQPVENLQIKLRDIDVGDYNTPPSEFLDNFSSPLPTSIAPVPGSLTFVLNSSHTIIFPDNQNNTDGWIQWDGSQSGISFDYHRLGGQGIWLDSIKFNCPCDTGNLITGETELFTCANQDITTNLTELIAGTTYQWSPATGLSNPNILNPTITVSQSTDYTIVATGDCGLTDTMIVSIDVENTAELLINGDSAIVGCPDEGFTPNLSANISGNTYSWEPTTSLSDPTVLNPEITITEPATYTLTATNPCTADALFQLDVNLFEPLDFELTPEVTICQGDSIEIPGTLNSPGEISWQNSNSLSDLSIANPTAFPNATTTYNVSVSDACETENQSIDVIVNEAPNLTGGSHIDLCVGDTAYANIQNTSNAGVDTWQWSPVAGLTHSNTPNPGVFNENDITYQVEATNSCGTDLFTVQLNTFELNANLDLDSIVCPGEPIPLSASGAAAYTWYPQDAMDNPHDSITAAHIYTDKLIQLQLSGGTCSEMFSDFVHVYHDIGFSKLDPVHLFPGQLYDLSPFETEYDIVFNESPLVSFYADTTMALIYTDKNGCEFSLYLPVTVEPVLYIPNSFTPDGDGLNDIFKAVGLNIENFEMRIFNRQGKMVFHSHSLGRGWNGGLDGYYCPDDIYNYIVTYSYHTTEVKTKRGFVTLLR